MDVVSAAQMRQLDQLANKKYNIPASTLMENAGRGAFEILRKVVPDLKNKKVLVIAGKGNNGGDAKVVARHLQGVAKGIQVFDLSSNPKNLSQLLTDCDLVVDGLFGTGLDRPVEGIAREIIEKINGSQKWVLVLDIPSGLSSDTGKPLGLAVRANLTVTMGLPKIGLLEPRAAELVGRVEVIDIGIPKETIESLRLKTHWVTAKDIRPYFQPRSLESHKGSNGHLLLIGGSASKPGSILLSGKAALRTGAGLVTVALPDKAFQKIPKNFLELMYQSLPSTKQGTSSRKGWKTLSKILANKDAVAIGPGMGVNGDTKFIVNQLGVRKRVSSLPLVCDADALNCLSPVKSQFVGSVIFTPHPGEMSRMTGKSTKQIQENRLEIAREFAKKHRVFLVLKGYRTITATPDGDIFINSTGNPGMATAGMGDVLTGIIGSLLAQGVEPKNAVIAAVYLHGRAGDRVANRLGDRGLLASDLIEEIPLAVRELVL